MVISCAEAVHSVQMLSLGQTQDPLTGMSSSAGIYVCALTSACGLQGPFSSAASCPFNKGALDEHYVGCWSCTSVCCCRCLDLVSTKAKEFKHFHAELDVDPAASKSLLAVLDGRGARAAVDADTPRAAR